MKYQTAIFDLDGTLLNTLGDLADAVNAAIVPHGLAAVDEEQVRQRVGNGVRNLMRRSMPEGMPDQDIDDCLAVFRAHYNVHLMDQTTPYPGIREVLKALKNAGMNIAVLSNKYDPATKALIAHFFPDMVDITFGERPGVPRKPDPSACLEAMERLGASPETTVYIGDSAVDIQTARNAGLDCISVTWGFRSRQELMENHAAVLVDSPQELLSMLIGIHEEELCKAFTAHGFGFHWFDNRAQAVEYLAKECAGKKVGFGGSMTLDEIGAFEALSNTADVHWHWKGEAPVMDAEVYITSANALSMNGEIVNIDGACNRVAASLWGAQECFVVCGKNKLEPDLETAMHRARMVAAPKNAQRLHKKTPCAADGKCHDCQSPERICRAMAIVMAPPIPMKRYEIILIDEVLGY